MGRITVLVCTAVVVVAGTQAPAANSHHTTVEFSNCVESIGVGLIATDAARAAVPPQFILAGEGQPATPLVVRTSDCEGIAVDGHHAKPGSIVQVGAVIVPPDFTGDINNYTILYYTTDARLAHALEQAGVSAQHVPTLTYDLDPGELHVRVPRPGRPTLSIAGLVAASNVPAGSFRANWWQSGRRGVVKMDTNVPVIAIGTANLMLSTNPHSVLGELLGSGSIGFPLLQQFNQFSAAHMEVSRVE